MSEEKAPDVAAIAVGLDLATRIEMLRRPGLRGSVEQRFLSKVKLDLSGCHIWQGPPSSWGYGRISTPWSHSTPAHHVAVWLLGKDIPKGMVVDHICRNRMCVNPEHLRVVTPLQNTLENSLCPSALNAKKTHCKHGHEFTPENTLHRRGERACRTCQNRMSNNHWRRTYVHKRPRHLMEKNDVQG